MRVGTIVRVPLHGRRVRGWVLDADVVEPEADATLREVLAVVSARARRADVVDLCRVGGVAVGRARWRRFLRAASAPNVVAAGQAVEVEPAVYPGAPLHGRAAATLIGPRADDRRADARARGLDAWSSTRRAARAARLASRLRATRAARS